MQQPHSTKHYLLSTTRTSPLRLQPLGEAGAEEEQEAGPELAAPTEVTEETEETAVVEEVVEDLTEVPSMPQGPQIAAVTATMLMVTKLGTVWLHTPVPG